MIDRRKAVYDAGQMESQHTNNPISAEAYLTVGCAVLNFPPAQNGLEIAAATGLANRSVSVARRLLAAQGRITLTPPAYVGRFSSPTPELPRHISDITLDIVHKAATCAVVNEQTLSASIGIDLSPDPAMLDAQPTAEHPIHPVSANCYLILDHIKEEYRNLNELAVTYDAMTQLYPRS
jgi:hypothetical protein